MTYGQRRDALALRLETTNDPQTKGALQRVIAGDYSGIGDAPAGLCCLGEACIVAKELGLDLFVDKPSDTGRVRFGENPQGSTMPAEVRDYFGFKGIDGRFLMSLGGHSSLMSMNDGSYYSDSWTFPQIAQVIRSRREGLFDLAHYPDDLEAD